MSRGGGGGPPVSSAGARRELSTGTKPDGGWAGMVVTEWKQQRENPEDGRLPQAPVRLLQQSPHETAPATTGQRIPITTSPRKIHVRRPRHMSFL